MFKHRTSPPKSRTVLHFTFNVAPVFAGIFGVAHLRTLGERVCSIVSIGDVTMKYGTKAACSNSIGVDYMGEIIDLYN